MTKERFAETILEPLVMLAAAGLLIWIGSTIALSMPDLPTPQTHITQSEDDFGVISAGTNPTQPKNLASMGNPLGSYGLMDF